VQHAAPEEHGDVAVHRDQIDGDAAPDELAVKLARRQRTLPGSKQLQQRPPALRHAPAVSAQRGLGARKERALLDLLRARVPPAPRRNPLSHGSPPQAVL
jgi:hypothetical protein